MVVGKPRKLGGKGKKEKDDPPPPPPLRSLGFCLLKSNYSSKYFSNYNFKIVGCKSSQWLRLLSTALDDIAGGTVLRDCMDKLAHMRPVNIASSIVRCFAKPAIMPPTRLDTRTHKLKIIIMNNN